ncbi:SH3 domain-containing protein [Streptomyces sp. BA2]|uniref:SH3 domain-containing protein n=1 Tax=Streptomyces sp. BA2 TaxID=436595 RepID=UPI001322C453|nr:SH3 domain-containing protein [Streptomyces sp. BA2]MWA08435.1 SH3 domain-containing protein [Streptomyces sp. BA2]
MMVRKAMSGCTAVVLVSAAMTGLAYADAPTAPDPGAAAAPRVTVTPTTAKQKTTVTVKVVGAPKACRSVQARSDAFVKAVALAKKGNPPVYSGKAGVKANAAPGPHQVVVGGVGCGKWAAKAKLTLLAPAPKPVKGKVISKAGVNVRQKPTSNSRITGAYRSGQTIDLICRKAGQPVAGNRTWYRVKTPQGWVTARYVKANGAVPICK